MTERTLVLLKPDAHRRGLIGEIIGRIERKAGWEITALELRTLDAGTLEQHYGEHQGKPFYEPLMGFMQSGPVVALIVEGERVVEGVRRLRQARRTRSLPRPAPSAATSAPSSARTSSTPPTRPSRPSARSPSSSRGASESSP
ncbi:Nucleoside diphosphate kinase [Streptomyces diastaticus subsp. diastaticus]